MTVYVYDTPPRAAVNNPIFIIRVTLPGDPPEGRNVHYLTWAMLEYDPKKATTAAETNGCTDLADLFNQGLVDGADAGLSIVRWVPPPGPLPPGVETNDA